MRGVLACARLGADHTIAMPQRLAGRSRLVPRGLERLPEPNKVVRASALHDHAAAAVKDFKGRTIAPARPFQFSRTQPSLRAIPNAKSVADILSDAAEKRVEEIHNERVQHQSVVE